MQKVSKNLNTSQSSQSNLKGVLHWKNSGIQHYLVVVELFSENASAREIGSFLKKLFYSGTINRAHFIFVNSKLISEKGLPFISSDVFDMYQNKLEVSQCAQKLRKPTGAACILAKTWCFHCPLKLHLLSKYDTQSQKVTPFNPSFFPNLYETSNGHAVAFVSPVNALNPTDGKNGFGNGSLLTSCYAFKAKFIVFPLLLQFNFKLEDTNKVAQSSNLSTITVNNKSLSSKSTIRKYLSFLEKVEEKKMVLVFGVGAFPYILPKLEFTRIYSRATWVYVTQTRFSRAGDSFKETESHMGIVYIILIFFGITLFLLERRIDAEKRIGKKYLIKIQNWSDWILALHKSLVGQQDIEKVFNIGRKGSNHHLAWLVFTLSWCTFTISSLYFTGIYLTTRALTPVRVAPIEPIEEILQNPEWKVGIFSKKDWWENTIRNSKFKAMFDRFEYLKSQNECVTKVIERKNFACFINPDVLLLLMSELPKGKQRKLVFREFQLVPSGVGGHRMGFVKDFPLAEKFTVAVSWLAEESGLTN
ncbi:unnamed protein product [Orchesella dallaii]|uniref:Uncharacterized protein n=1 Tax=Orchesella dallaii TaxID=48710 RepID=A0ABP1QNT6_9HEXA